VSGLVTKSAELMFVLQKHDATKLHYDFKTRNKRRLGVCSGRG
jgi:hypothetical protein